MLTFSVRSIVISLTLCLMLSSATPMQASETLQTQEPAMFLPAGFAQETVVAGLDGPTAFDFAGDGRIFITQKSGVVRVVEDGELLADSFIDLSHEVNHAFNRGLMGIALHPNFPYTPYVYLSYTYEPPEAAAFSDDGARVSRVVRVSATAGETNRWQEGSTVVLAGTNSTFEHIGDPDRPNQQPYACTDESGEPIRDCLALEGTAHTVNDLRFGADGTLYVTAGDGIDYSAGSLRAQDLDSLNGKVLRINPYNGNGYASNPFYDGDAGSNRSKVYALGLRNPFRFSIHPWTGQLLVGDVGDLSFEEVNRGRAGANFGWPCLEGAKERATDPICEPVLDGRTATTPALYAYPHERGYGAVIGGEIYTGRSYPAHYRGAYFFGDFNAGAIQYLTFGAGGTKVNDFASLALGPSQIRVGPDGNLYVLSVMLGKLFRIRYVGSAAAAPTPEGRALSTPTPPGSDAEEETDSQSPASPAAATTTPLPDGGGSGHILREWWTGIGGGQVSDLTAADGYPDQPDGSEKLSRFETTMTGEKDYGARISGYIHPPVTGSYQFWIAADDRAELWLSRDASPGNARLIANVPAWTSMREWEKHGEQTSVSISLRAGQRYYIEARHKQSDQKDNVAVAWQIPGEVRAVIDGAYLSPAVR